MTILPILRRELHVRARQGGTYWGRFAVGFLGAVFCLIQFFTMSSVGSGATTGRTVFDVIVVAAFGVACLACVFTFDAISREHREGTLGLLLLTRVSKLDILLGKLGAGGLDVLCAVIAFLPVLMIPVLGGGVSGGEALRKGLVLVNTMFFSLAAGLWGSVGVERRSRAITRALYPILGVLILPAMLSLLSLPPGLHLMSPLFGLSLGGDPDFSLWPAGFWISLAISQGLAWLLLSRAATNLARFPGRNAGEMTAAAIKKAELLQPSLVYARARQRIRESNPIDWLVRRQGGTKTALWLAAAVMVAYYALSWVYEQRLGYGWPYALIWPTYASVTLLSDALLAWAACQFFLESKRAGHLEMLVTTPLGINALVNGQWSGLKKLLRWPIALSLGAMLLDETYIVSTVVQPEAGFTFSRFVYPINWLLSSAEGLAEVVAVCWLAMWYAVQGRNQAGVLFRTLALATVLPLALNAAVWFLLEPWNTQLFGAGWKPWLFLGWGEQVVAVFYFAWLIRFARKRILQELSGGAPMTGARSRSKASLADKQSTMPNLDNRGLHNLFAVNRHRHFVSRLRRAVKFQPA